MAIGSPKEIYGGEHKVQLVLMNSAYTGARSSRERQNLRKASEDQRPVGEEKVNKAELESHLLASRGMSGATRGANG
jgi:hypothetical protein